MCFYGQETNQSETGNTLSLSTFTYCVYTINFNYFPPSYARWLHWDKWKNSPFCHGSVDSHTMSGIMPVQVRSWYWMRQSICGTLYNAVTKGEKPLFYKIVFSRQHNVLILMGLGAYHWNCRKRRSNYYYCTLKRTICSLSLCLFRLNTSNELLYVCMCA